MIMDWGANSCRSKRQFLPFQYGSDIDTYSVPTLAKPRDRSGLTKASARLLQPRHDHVTTLQRPPRGRENTMTSRQCREDLHKVARKPQSAATLRPLRSREVATTNSFSFSFLIEIATNFFYFFIFFIFFRI